MSYQAQNTAARTSCNVGEATDGSKHEPVVRSRWMPKPEQILILESIFNSGMVNPPKEETVRIRKMLEKFGSVGDANVFYWFQNRRSRSRRRQRQIQASLNAGVPPQTLPPLKGGGPGGVKYDNSSHVAAAAAPGGCFHDVPNSSTFSTNPSSGCLVGSGSSSYYGMAENDSVCNNFLSFSAHSAIQELEQNPFFYHSDASNLQFQSAITVFINGIATEVGRGPVDLKGMFGGDFMLFHSSGMPLHVNEYGYLVQRLQHGESYFMVPRNS